MRKTILILSQVYVPDPASVGQHMADVAAEMARRGWRVVVLAADRGYDDPSIRYPRHESADGVEVRRLPWSSFGKRSIPIRLLGGVLFLIQAVGVGLFTRGLSRILVSTSPPLCPVAALIIAVCRRVPIKYWVMDLNPDQMVSLGKLRPQAWPVRLFDKLNRAILKRAADVVVLDQYMAKRVVKKYDVTEKLTVLPPWPHEGHLDRVAHDENPFRQEHGLGSRFVVMYSGNHSIASPVDTILEAAARLKDVERLAFLFVGGGAAKPQVDQTIERLGLTNVLSLPYQPLDRLRFSLSAADVHLVALGDGIVGICHPCKVYGAMVVGRPILLLGPAPSHVSDILEADDIGWRIGHGDVDQAEALLRRVADIDPAELDAMGGRAARVVADRFSKDRLCGAFCDVLERG